MVKAATVKVDTVTLSEATPRSTPRVRGPPDLDMAADTVDTARADMAVDTADMAVVDTPTSTVLMLVTVDLVDMATVDLVDMATVDLEDMATVDLDMDIRSDVFKGLPPAKSVVCFRSFN